MPPLADPPRLLPGCHLYAGSDGTWRYHLPGDRFVRITAAPQDLHAARRLLHGHPGDAPAPSTRALVDALAGQGVLATAAPQARRGRIHVRGDGPIAAELRRLLAGAGHEVAADVTAGLDAVVACAGWLTDSAWQALSAQCAGLGVAWHGCYTEGTRWFTGPMAVPGRTAGYADTRARRLGACGVPDELRGYWAYLDRGAELPPVPWPGAGVVAVIAGLLAADVEAYLTTGRPAAYGQQLEIDPGTLGITAHPVLPLPFPVAVA